MKYEPLTVTKDNMEWAVRENLRRIYATIQWKLQVGRETWTDDLNLCDHPLIQLHPAVHDYDLVTKEQAEELINKAFQE